MDFNLIAIWTGVERIEGWKLKFRKNLELANCTFYETRYHYEIIFSVSDVWTNINTNEATKTIPWQHGKGFKFII